MSEKRKRGGEMPDAEQTDYLCHRCCYWCGKTSRIFIDGAKLKGAIGRVQGISENKYDCWNCVYSHAMQSLGNLPVLECVIREASGSSPHVVPSSKPRHHSYSPRLPAIEEVEEEHMETEGRFRLSTNPDTS